jgi:Arc/MetJ-type ribon-helix-helix transcriptional regulator
MYEGWRAMVRTQIYLKEAQLEALRRLAAQTGRRQSALIRDAVDRMIAQAPPEEDRLLRLRRAFGAWADHDDIEEVMADNRRSLQEREERLWRRS